MTAAATPPPPPAVLTATAARQLAAQLIESAAFIEIDSGKAWLRRRLGAA